MGTTSLRGTDPLIAKTLVISYQLTDIVSHVCRIDVQQRDSDRITASSSDGRCSVMITVMPFAVDVDCSGKLVASINSRSLLRFNIGRVKPR